jgi:hypothetical protein
MLVDATDTVQVLENVLACSFKEKFCFISEDQRGWTPVSPR